MPPGRRDRSIRTGMKDEAGPEGAARASRRDLAESVMRQIWRSTIIFLISAMALAGLRLFGHAWAQFMMVWQR